MWRGNCEAGRVGRLVELASRYLRWSTVGVALCFTATCEDESERQPAGWDDELRMALAEDLDAAPDVLEVELVAQEADLQLRAGARTHLFTYNGSLPGPMLRLRQGDRLLVHFRNELSEPTSIHWHGVRLDNAMDGAPPHTQAAVMPGDTFDYDFIVPDAGTFWYHPHVRSAAQVGFGMYGALIVDPRTGPESAAVLGDELVVMLSDISLDDDNRLVDPDSGGELGTLFGREGEPVLANGKYRAWLRATRGLRQRWRVINAARSRYFQLDLGGLPFTQIGGDAGMLAKPVETTAPVIVPGGRADLVVEPTGVAHDGIPLQWVPFNRGFGSIEFRTPLTLFSVGLSDTVASEPLPLTPIAVPVEPLSAEGATPVDIELTEQTAADGSLTLGINGVPFAESTPITASVGETQLWTVTNRMQFSHPFHLHGFFFQPLDENGVSVGEWRDTVDVPHDDGKLRFLDVPLPHPRPRRGGHDGHGRPSPVARRARLAPKRSFCAVVGLLATQFGAT
jgi:FtsP/CotA-like multicopper oxidase with cupredoxin domain